MSPDLGHATFNTEPLCLVFLSRIICDFFRTAEITAHPAYPLL